MTLDLSSLSPQARLQCIRIGRRWSSEDTIAQADDVLKALEVHGATLANHGFSAEDAQRLAAVRNALDAKVHGSSGDGDVPPKVTSAAYLEAMREGKRVRKLARTVLASVEGIFAERRGTTAESALHRLITVLGETQSSGADDEALVHQLELLQGALRDPDVGAEAVSRGGLLALREIESALAKLRAIAEPSPAASEELSAADECNLLDGIIVFLVRAARRAARIAATWTGNPELAQAFELTKLHASAANPLGLLNEREPSPADYGWLSAEESS